MGVSLSKGENVSITKEVPGLEAIKVGCGWDAQDLSGKAFDLDLSVFLCGKGSTEFIYFNNRESADKTVVHTGDNRTGQGEGDDEVVMMAVSNISPDIEKAVFTVTIYEAEGRKQNFGMVDNAFIRIVDAKDDTEIARYDLTEDFSGDTAVTFGEVYRKDGGEWKFKAVGQGAEGGLSAFCKKYGVDVG